MEARIFGAHVEAPGAHGGAHGGAHFGAQVGAQGAHGGAHFGAHVGSPGAHSGAQAPPPEAHLGEHLGAFSSPLPPPEGNKNVLFQHPFTMMISGPTACGKTTMVKELLQNHSTNIQPNVQRIVWLYKRWQPLYSIIKETVLPRVEFVQGIPTDLEDDDFFDSRINNLLILDDLFSEAGRDKRVTDLFTEGSHHRSLSVISINQNLFGNKDPTQRRNCHYLVLFNNPVDKQSVMTLARQMYPGQSDIFMKQFSKATKYPYGHLLVDLKPHVTGGKTINEANLQETGHSSTSTQTDNIAEEPENTDKGQACDDCGQLFDTTHDVQRHVKNGWCPEHRESKKRPHEEISDSEQEEPVEDNEGYVKLWKVARTHNERKYDQMYNKLIDNGEESDEAKESADDRIQPYNEKGFLGLYPSLIDRYILPLRNSRLHTQIMSQVDKLISKGHSTTSAATKVIRKHRKYFEDLFDLESSEDEEEESGEESDASGDENDYLKNIYYNPEHAAAFAGPQKLYQVVKNEGKFNIGMHRIRRFLHDQESYSLHKPTRRRFQRNHVVSAGKDDLWMADLIDMVKFADWNQGFKYILLVIDTFSKYVWLQPLKYKTGDEVARAFEKIFTTYNRSPTKLITDKGQEFRAKKVQNHMKKEEIHYFPTQNETKASTSERAILTIKTRLMRYFSYKETATFLPVIQDIADSYNKTHHRTIGMRPVDVKASNQEEVRLATYFTRNPKSKKQGPKLKQFKLK
ncbi:YMD3-like protein, partial [Mya arenaria]